MTPVVIPDALLSDPFYPRLKEHLVESTGLAYYHDKDADFARRIGHRLESLGCGIAGRILMCFGTRSAVPPNWTV
jgi:hypothetical protein